MSEKQMTGRITGIKRFAVHDGDGIRTTVFLKGCPLSCVWCHNPESIDFAPETAYFAHLCRHCETCLGEDCPFGARVRYGEAIDVETLCQKLLADRPFYESSGGGVTLSGGECLAQPAFALAVTRELHAQGISVDIDTCGAVAWETMAQILPYTDTFLYDVKAIVPDVHQRCTGRENHLILENLKRLCEHGARVEIRYPLVMGWNDGEAEKIGAFLSDLCGIVRVKVLAYHDFARSRYTALGKTDTMPQTKTTEEDVRRIVATLQSFGLPAISGSEA